MKLPADCRSVRQFCKQRRFPVRPVGGQFKRPKHYVDVHRDTSIYSPGALVNRIRAICQSRFQALARFAAGESQRPQMGLKWNPVSSDAVAMRRPTKKRLYLLFLVGACLFSMWQLYELAKWRAEVVARHPGVTRPWQQR